MNTRKLAITLLARFGVNRLVRPVAAGRGVVLMLHRVIAPGAVTLLPGNATSTEQLDRALGRIRRSGWEIIGLDEAREALSKESRSRFVCLTFDDGYRDNLTLGREVLAAHRAPWTVYACVGFLDRATEIAAAGEVRYVRWLDAVLERLLLDNETLAIGHPEFPDPLPARTLDEKRAALAAVYRAEARDSLGIFRACEEAANALGTSVGAILDDVYLSWDELRVLARSPGVSVGSHLLTHPVLRRLSDDAAHFELSESRRRIEHELGVPVRHLAYPYGGRAEVGPRDFALAAELGYATAVTTRYGNLFAAHKEAPHAWPRFGISVVEHSASVQYLDAVLNGSWGLLANRLREVVVTT
jgi:peptidoglycan/xylan/chitin deacetylase (PgdA/CDA1 family)